MSRFFTKKKWYIFTVLADVNVVSMKLPGNWNEASYTAIMSLLVAQRSYCMYVRGRRFWEKQYGATNLDSVFVYNSISRWCERSVANIVQKLEGTTPQNYVATRSAMLIRGRRFQKQKRGSPDRGLVPGTRCVCAVVQWLMWDSVLETVGKLEGPHRNPIIIIQAQLPLRTRNALTWKAFFRIKTAGSWTACSSK